MDIYVMIQVIKYKEFKFYLCIQVLFLYYKIQRVQVLFIYSSFIYAFFIYPTFRLI